jgi:large subunit ribosomal protein L30
MSSAKTFTVTLVKSMNGTREAHRATVRGLGLKKIGQTATVVDTPATRGMATKVAYLVRVEG